MTTDQRTSDLRPIGDGPDGPDGPHVPIDVPPTTLPGAIGKRWKALGGLAWGTPSFELQPAGAGLWCQFTLKDGSLASIFSSANTAACVVTARINAAYVRADRATGPLGFPTTDEQPTHDGVGRFQMFQGGLVAWHPTIGALAVQGAINARYLALGGTRFGYPISDEGGTPDGRGRFNHFRNVQTGAELSIYWTPSTGAHEVFGFIRTHYAQLGWERSPLGYPTSGELATHDKVGRFATFEHGVIVWHPKTGALATWGPINDCYAPRRQRLRLPDDRSDDRTGRKGPVRPPPSPRRRRRTQHLLAPGHRRPRGPRADPAPLGRARLGAQLPRLPDE